jgi:hypothetical protein
MNSPVFRTALSQASGVSLTAKERVLDSGTLIDRKRLTLDLHEKAAWR